MIFKKRVYNVITIFLFLLLVGTLVYHNLEGWRYLDSLYFTVVTMTTIGYGDFTPQTVLKDLDLKHQNLQRV